MDAKTYITIRLEELKARRAKAEQFIMSNEMKFETVLLTAQIDALECLHKAIVKALADSREPDWENIPKSGG